MSYTQPELHHPHPQSAHHQRNASSYISAEAASPAFERESLGNLNNLTLDSPPPPRSPRLSSAPVSPRNAHFDRSIRDASQEGFRVSNIGRAIVGRVVRSAKRGNLPFIVIFLSCVLIFFSALAGIGYVDPDASPAQEAGFMPGLPIYDPNEAGEMAQRRRVEEQRELERSWQKKKRPKDGAWMQKQRDDKAVRRVPVKAPETAPVEVYDTQAGEGEGEGKTLAKRTLDEHIVTRDPWETVGLAEENQYDSAVTPAEGLEARS